MKNNCLLLENFTQKLQKKEAQNAVLMAIRLTYLILGTSIMNIDDNPNQLTDGLEKSLMPLNEDRGSGAYHCDDDVHCPPLYPNPYRRD